MTAFLGSFLTSVIEMIILVAVMLVGIFAGKKLRDRKSAQLAEIAAQTPQIDAEGKQ